jgi:O-antigen ligase
MAEASAFPQIYGTRLPPWLFLTIGLAVVAVSFAALDEPLAAAIVIALPLLPFLYFAGIRGLAGDRGFAALLAVATIFVLCANFRYREFTEKSIDFQIALKVAAIAATLALSAISFRTIVRHLYLHGLAYWLAFYGFLVFSSSYAMAPAHAAVCTLSLLASFLFLCHLCVKFGPIRLVEALVWTGLLMCIVSLVVYVAVPSFGRMFDWVGDELVLTSRLQGIFGATNGAGSAAATLFLLTAVYYVGQPYASRMVAYPTLATSFLCLVLSNNRMALGSLALSGLLYFLVSGRFGRKLVLVLSLGMIVMVPVLLFPDDIFSMLSRSGSADEITSGTGRTRIWAVVLELVPQAWLFGHGYASGQHILPMRPDLFQAAAHAHNLYLEVLFCGGVIGLALLLWCILTSLVLAVRVGGARELALFSFFLTYGITEPIIGGTAYLGLIIWQASVVLLFYRARHVEMERARAMHWLQASAP